MHTNQKFKKFAKPISIGIFASLLLLIAYLIFYERSQEIDFASMLTGKLQCNEKPIDSSEFAIKTLKTWLLKNRNGWRNTPATYVPGHVINAENISINVSGLGVIINYQDQDKKWNQVIKNKQKEELDINCE